VLTLSSSGITLTPPGGTTDEVTIDETTDETTTDEETTGKSSLFFPDLEGEVKKKTPC